MFNFMGGSQTISSHFVKYVLFMVGVTVLHHPGFSSVFKPMWTDVSLICFLNNSIKCLTVGSCLATVAASSKSKSLICVRGCGRDVVHMKVFCWSSPSVNPHFLSTQTLEPLL